VIIGWSAICELMGKSSQPLASSKSCLLLSLPGALQSSFTYKTFKDEFKATFENENFKV
jgi:hypothetical protein